MARGLMTWTMVAGVCAFAVSSSTSLDTEAGGAASTNLESIVASAQVWSRGDVARRDMRMGPFDPTGFAPGQTVTCDYVNKKLPGSSPKFACAISANDEIKVKYGGTNGEVYGEVAATRLLWALGFGADRMYPVRVICRRCPNSLMGIQTAKGELIVDPAVIERKMPGTPVSKDDQGWGWDELDLIDEHAGGAPRAQRDALKLLAVLLQHTDSKPEQQRIICLDATPRKGECARPFMMIDDLGLTFGRANWANANAKGSVNFDAWSRTPVWKDNAICVGNLPKSFSGTLNDPVIGEEGRRFLADLLTQLTDAQLHDLFDVARFKLRPRSPERGDSGFPSTQEWVEAFKDKRTQIVERRCA